MRIWRRAYRPFILGGNVNQPIATEAMVVGSVDLGKGFGGFVVEDCNGETAVIEATSGAYVGGRVEDVRGDIEACDDIQMMIKQISDGVEQAKEAVMVSPKEFWNGRGD